MVQPIKLASIENDIEEVKEFDVDADSDKPVDPRQIKVVVEETDEVKLSESKTKSNLALARSFTVDGLKTNPSYSI